MAATTMASILRASSWTAWRPGCGSEGCEWDALLDDASRSAPVLAAADEVYLELHVPAPAPDLLAKVAAAHHFLFGRLGLRLWFLHANPGAEHDREVPRELVRLGLDPSTCCYEVGLRREAKHCHE